MRAGDVVVRLSEEGGEDEAHGGRRGLRGCAGARRLLSVSLRCACVAAATATRWRPAGPRRAASTRSLARAEAPVEGRPVDAELSGDLGC